MPNSYGKWYSKERDQVLAWINDKWTHGKDCAVCGNRNWALGEYAVAPVPLAASVISTSAPTFPHAMVTCKTCAYSMFFNTVVMGISPKLEHGDEFMPRADVRHVALAEAMVRATRGPLGQFNTKNENEDGGA